MEACSCTQPSFCVSTGWQRLKQVQQVIQCAGSMLWVSRSMQLQGTCRTGDAAAFVRQLAVVVLWTHFIRAQSLFKLLMRAKSDLHRQTCTNRPAMPWLSAIGCHDAVH